MRGLLAKRVLAAAAVAAVAAACSGTEKTPDEKANVLPTSYRPQIIKLLRDRLPDPTGIRDAYITEPTLKQSGNVPRYIVCVRYNAKGHEKKYAGSTDKAVYFYAGEITQMVDAPPELCATNAVAYQPWLELQKLCIQAVCPQ